MVHGMDSPNLQSLVFLSQITHLCLWEWHLTPDVVVGELDCLTNLKALQVCHAHLTS